ncbi:MAG TPA: hypothetical protein VFH48_11065 [Chloroflexota bacterium]|nr:hypothetical protein [Chloroflexota bacterium]
MSERAFVHSPACLVDADAWQLAEPTTATTRPAANHARQRRHQGAGASGEWVGQGGCCGHVPRLLWSCQRGDPLVSRGQLGRESAPVLAELGNGVGLALDRLSLPADRGVLHGQPFGQGSDRRRDRC